MARVRRHFAVGLVFLGLVVYSPPASAGISFFNFQLSAIGAFAGPSTIFAHLAWTPSIAVGPVGVRGELGVTSLQFGSGPRFIATNYEVLLQLSLAPTFTIEGGGGIHIWHGQIGASPGITGNLVFTGVPWATRVFIGYTRYTGGVGADELRAGLGFDL